jgi:hypothetical protein
MAPPFPAAELTSPITTRSPRTSLIDAEWEWLARRAETSDASGSLAFAERDTAPGLAPFTPTALPSTSETGPASTTRINALLKLAFVATALCSFALGMVALPVAESIARGLHQGSRPDRYVAQLVLPRSEEPAPALANEPAPPPELTEPSPVLQEEPVALTAAPQMKPLAAAARPARARSARRHWSPAPARAPQTQSDNPY